jgi:hypothetical protein
MKEPSSRISSGVRLATCFGIDPQLVSDTLQRADSEKDNFSLSSTATEIFEQLMSTEMSVSRYSFVENIQPFASYRYTFP